MLILLAEPANNGRRALIRRAKTRGGMILAARAALPAARHDRLTHSGVLQFSNDGYKLCALSWLAGVCHALHKQIYDIPADSRHTSKKVIGMPSVKLKENEPFDVALRRFKRSCEKAGVLAEVRRREFYEKPTSVRKRKQAAAVKRHAKKLQREARRLQKPY